jgi:exosortase/archaeosortase family protein
VRLFYARHRNIIRALGIYAWSLTLLLLLYNWLDGTVFLYRFLEYNAQATGLLAKVFDPGVTVDGTTVVSDGSAIVVVKGCTSLAPFAIFASAVFAVPTSLSRKFLGIVGGFVALAALNLVRITSLLYLGSAFPSVLEVVHLLVWQSIMVLLSVVLWLWWRSKWGRDGSS